MTVPAKNPRDLPSLASEINAEHEAAEKAINDSLQHARRCGELLNEAKAQCRHGEWQAWVEDNFASSYRTAASYMKLARANVQRVAGLSIREALAELAEPREPEPADEGTAGERLLWDAPRLPITRPDGFMLVGRTATATVFVQPSTYDGYEHVSFLWLDDENGGSLAGTTKPIRSDAVPYFLQIHEFDVPQATGWEVLRAEPVARNPWFRNGAQEYVHRGLLEPVEGAA